LLCANQRKILDEIGLQCFAKTSGSKGLQLYLPLNTATTYDKTKAFAHALAERLEREILMRLSRAFGFSAFG
jgi:bifunctional non-homologous end joining protein LigD